MLEERLGVPVQDEEYVGEARRGLEEALRGNEEAKRELEKGLRKIEEGKMEIEEGRRKLDLFPLEEPAVESGRRTTLPSDSLIRPKIDFSDSRPRSAAVVRRLPETDPLVASLRVAPEETGHSRQALLGDYDQRGDRRLSLNSNDFAGRDARMGEGVPQLIEAPAEARQVAIKLEEEDRSNPRRDLQSYQVI